MTIRFACEHCGQRLSVSEQKVGKKAKCPKCKAQISVPTLEAGAAQLAEIRAGRAEPEADDMFAEFVVYDDESSELIYETAEEPTREAESGDDLAHVAVPRWVLYAQGVLLGVVAMLAFTLGIVVGGSTAPTSPDDGNGDGPVAVAGRVTYLNSANRATPDDGAVVIAVPTSAQPEQKIAIEGLRPDDPPPPGNHPGLMAIHQLGGGLARIDIDGNYRLQLAGAGRYFVLMVSRHTRAQDNAEPNIENLAQMGRYFSSAVDLLAPDNSDPNKSKYKYVWLNERVRGNARLDHDFGRTRE